MARDKSMLDDKGQGSSRSCLLPHQEHSISQLHKVCQACHLSVGVMSHDCVCCASQLLACLR